MRTNNKEIKEFEFNEIIPFLYRHKNIILLSVILCTLASFYYTFTVPPVYEAKASILIKQSQGSSSVLDLIGNNKKVQIENEKTLITSRIVAEETVKSLWKTQHRNNLDCFGTRPYLARGQSIRKNLKKILTLGFYEHKDLDKIVHEDDYSLGQLRNYASFIKRNLSVESQKDTEILILTYKSTYRDEATIVLNQIIKSYIDIDKKWSADQAYSILNFVEKQSSDIEQELSVAEEKLKIFKEKEGIYDLSGNSELILDQLINAESMFYNTQAEINVLKESKKYLSSKLSHEEKTLATKLLNSINSKLFILRGEISQKESEIVKSETIYGENHDVVLRSKQEVSALKEKLDNQIDILINQGLIVADPVEYRQELIENLLIVESELSNQNAKLNEYQKLTQIYNQQLNALPSLQLSFARLERDRSVLNQTYVFMRQQLEESRIKVASEMGKVLRIDDAINPNSKSSPNHKNNLILGVFIGLFLGVAIGFLIESLDRSIKSIDELKAYSILGIIPSITKSKESYYSNKFSIKYFINSFQNYWDLLTKKPLPSSKATRHLITHDDPKSPISEAYRSLRTSIVYSGKKDIKSMVISSTGPGEGKTTTISNIAITYANLGKKVLLIDTDLRKPVLHNVFELSKDNGITSFLSGVENDINKIIKNTKIENLNVISAGIVPPNPSELLASEKMKEFISLAESKFDIVLFDSPPLVAVTDAAILSKHLDSLVLVVMPGKTDKKGFMHCIDFLSGMDAKLSGLVLNGVNARNSYGSYYYNYNYYHYYGTDDA